MKKKRVKGKHPVKPQEPHKFHLGETVIVTSVERELFKHRRVVIPVLFAALFALIGVAVLLQSRADTIYSSNPNEVVLEYELPHLDLKPTENLMHSADQPFKLYGDGSLFCGQQARDQFTAPRTHSAETLIHSSKAPTYKKLSKQEMTALIQSVRDAGFEKLNPEYYVSPVAQQKHTVRLVVSGVDKFVFYYNDTAAPDAYKKTLEILRNACANVTKPYVSTTVQLSARADADTHGKPLQMITSGTVGKENVNKVLRESKNRKQQNDIKRSNQTQIEEGDNYSEVVTGQSAKDLQTFSKGQSRLFVLDNGTTYELGIDPQLPEVKNPLTVDIKQVRADFEHKKQTEAQKVSWLNKLFSSPKASASVVPEPEAFRLVYLYPSDGNNDTKLALTRGEGNRIKDWYCLKVGRCPDYNGVVEFKGSQTKAWYEACHKPAGCTGYDDDHLNRIMDNAFAKDEGLSKGNVITILIPAWSVPSKYCGWGELGGNRAIADVFDNICTSIPSAAHELGHTFDLQHVCQNYNLMVSGCDVNFCDIQNPNRPGCVLNSTQTTKLKQDYEHFSVPNSLVSGRVYDSVTGTGIFRVKIATCVNNPANFDNAQYTYTDENGRWSMRYTTGTAFCARVESALTELEGPVLNNNPEHAGATTYENQISGKNCYKNSTCTIARQSWDRSSDTGYDFAYKRTNGSLYYIQKANTASGKVEIQRAPVSTNYTLLDPKVVTPITTAEAADGYFQVSRDDLSFVKWRNTASGNVEVNTLTKASNYATVTKKEIGVTTASLDGVRPAFYISGDDLFIVKTLNAGQGGMIAIKKYDIKMGYNYVYTKGPITEAEAANGIIQPITQRDVAFMKNKNTVLGYLAYIRLLETTAGWNDIIRQPTYFSNSYAADLWPAVDRLNGQNINDVVAVRSKGTASGKVEIMIDRGPDLGNLDKTIVTAFPVNTTTNGIWVVSR